METEILSPPVRTGRDEKRDAILRIALEAFLTEGYAATSMSSIAAKVGGSKATLYNYFASKEELFSVVIGEKCKDFHDQLFESVSHDADIRAALIGIAERMIRLVVSDEKIAIYRLITAETARFPELGRAFYRTGPEQGKKFMAEYFDRAVAEGKLKPGDTLVMAGHFFDLCKGELHQRKLWNVASHITDKEIHERACQAIDVFLAAYGA